MDLEMCLTNGLDLILTYAYDHARIFISVQ